MKSVRSRSSDSPITSPVKLARGVTPLNRLILFVRAGGRCEFDGCNKYLLEHHVTLKEGNFAEVAHIVAFRPDGPRGHSGGRPQDIDSVDNLMVLCPPCHKLVDDHPETYSKTVLQKYKARHEAHIRHMTGLSPERKTSILVFTATVGDQSTAVPFEQIVEAVAPRYPASRPGTLIDLTNIRTNDPESLAPAKDAVRRAVMHLYEAGGELERTQHLSLFAIGPIPLLVDLGARLSNKIATDLFQRHRHSEDWTWQATDSGTEYQLHRRRAGSEPHHVALLLSLSGTVHLDDLPDGIDPTYPVYEMTLGPRPPDPTFLRSKHDLEGFRLAYRAGLAAIRTAHASVRHVHLLPAVPAPIAVLCGRELLPKVDPELLVYDFDKQKKGFRYQLTVNNNEN